MDPMISSGTIRCGLYVRVSTDKQADTEFSSLETQEAVLRDLVVQKNALRKLDEPKWVIVDVYVEKRSAKDTNRPQFQRLLRDVRSDAVNMIVFIRLDRFSRSLKDFLSLQDFLLDHHCGFVSKHDPILDTSSPHGEFIVRLLLLLAELERKLTAARTREKMRWRAEEGLWNGGIPSLGYERDPKNKSILVPHPEHCKIIRLIFKTYPKAGSATELVRWLASNGYTIPVRTLSKGRTVGGDHFYKSLVLKILKDRLYIGEVGYKDKRVPKDLRAREWFPGKHQPIVHHELFDRVQAVLKKRRETMKNLHPNGQRPYALQGVFYCGQCFSSLTPKRCDGRGGVPHYYYSCSRANQSAGIECDAKYVPAEAVEQAVVAEIQRVALADAEIEQIVREANDGADESLMAVKRQKVSVESRLKDVNRRIGNINDIIADQGKDAFRSNRETLAELEAERSELEAQFRQLTGELNDLRSTKVERSAIEAALKTFAQIVEAATPDEKKILVGQIVRYAVWTWTAPGEGRLEIALYEEFKGGPPDLSGAAVPLGAGSKNGNGTSSSLVRGSVGVGSPRWPPKDVSDVSTPRGLTRSPSAVDGSDPTDASASSSLKPARSTTGSPSRWQAPSSRRSSTSVCWTPARSVRDPSLPGCWASRRLASRKS